MLGTGNNKADKSIQVKTSRRPQAESCSSYMFFSNAGLLRITIKTGLLLPHEHSGRAQRRQKIETRQLGMCRFLTVKVYVHLARFY